MCVRTDESQRTKKQVQLYSTQACRARAGSVNNVYVDEVPFSAYLADSFKTKGFDGVFASGAQGRGYSENDAN